MKRLSPSSDTNDLADQPVKKTHRTHEENQERAYIAASRRADRDIEHRIRSAMKASECRRKRTGRGLKITREAVMGDEQYESEEEDHTARRFSLPTGVPAGSAGAGAGAGLTNPYFPSPTDRYDEVDALFAKSFPHLNLTAGWAAQQEQLQQRQRQQQFQQGQTQPHTHRHSYSHPYTPANATAAAAAAAATAGNGYTPRFKQHAPAPIHTHLQPQPSLVDHHSSPSPNTPISASNPPLSAMSAMSYPLPPAHAHSAGEHAAAGRSGNGLGIMGANAYPLAPPRSPSPGMALFGGGGGRSTYPLDMESGGSGDGSPMGGADEYYYSGSVSPASPLGVGIGGGDDIDDETRGALLNGIDFAGADAEAAWLASGGSGVNNGVNGNSEGAFYARSLSLPSVLGQFQFGAAAGGFDSASAAAAAAAAADAMMIDPSILSSAASVAMPSQEGGVGGAGAAAETMKDVWADWVNFDAEVKV